MLSQNVTIILFALGLFMLLIYSLVVNCDSVKESWVNYEQLPYGNIQSGAGSRDITPLVFYEYPVYRRPYNYPICHLVDYPVPHCRTDSLLIVYR
jgi:hypothetical protein